MLMNRILGWQADSRVPPLCKTLHCIIKLSFSVMSLSFLCIQGIAGDIQAHERAYEELCLKCWEQVARGTMSCMTRTACAWHCILCGHILY